MANKSCPIAVDVMFHREDKGQGRFNFLQWINEIEVREQLDSLQVLWDFSQFIPLKKLNVQKRVFYADFNHAIVIAKEE